MATFLRGNKTGTALAEAVGLDPHIVRRVVIEASTNDMTTVTFTCYVSHEMLAKFMEQVGG